jgi:hypothetical protein
LRLLFASRLVKSTTLINPSISLCPGTQWRLTVAPFSFTFRADLITLIRQSWPGLSDGVLSLHNPAWLSEKMSKLGPGLAFRAAYSTARVELQAPLVVLCWYSSFRTVSIVRVCFDYYSSSYSYSFLRNIRRNVGVDKDAIFARFCGTILRCPLFLLRGIGQPSPSWRPQPDEG